MNTFKKVQEIAANDQTSGVAGMVERRNNALNVNIVNRLEVSKVEVVNQPTGIAVNNQRDNFAVNNFPTGFNVNNFPSVQNVAVQESPKTRVMKTGTLSTATAAADQSVLTYTVTAAKTFYLQYLDVQASAATLVTLATRLGTASLEIDGVKSYTGDFVATINLQNNIIHLEFGEPVQIAAGKAVRVIVTPSSLAGVKWTANFGGYER